MADPRIVVEFDGTIPPTDNVNPYQVPCVRGRHSAVLPFVVKCDTAGYFRQGPNPITLSDRVRVAATEDALEDADWGGTFALASNVHAWGVLLFAQFRSLPGDVGELYALEDAMALEQSGITAEDGVSGTVAATSAATLAVTSKRVISGTVAAVSAASLSVGSASQTYPISGTVPVTSAATLAAENSRYWSDDFSTDQTALWTDSADNGGAKSVTGGQFIINTLDSVTKRVMRESVKPIKFDASGTLTVTAVAGSVTPTTNTMVVLSLFKTPGLTVSSTLTGLAQATISYRTDAASVAMTYVNGSGVTQYWNGTSWTSTQSSLNQTVNAGDALEGIAEFNGTQMRLTIKQNGVTVATTAWVNISDINGQPNGYVMFRDSSTTVGYNTAYDSVVYAA